MKKTFSDIIKEAIDKQFICRINKEDLDQLSDSEKIEVANYLVEDIPNVIITKR